MHDIFLLILQGDDELQSVTRLFKLLQKLF